MTDEDEKNEAMVSARFNQKVANFAPMVKRQYKNHKNGHGILIWKCKQCGDELNDIMTKFQKREICESCSEDNRIFKARLNYHEKKVGVKINS